MKRISFIFRCLGCVGFAFLLVLGGINFVQGQWTEPVLLRPPINVDPPGSYYYSTISADGQVLCMTIFPGQYGDDDVYISERIDDSTWTRPVNAGPNVNNEARNLSPSITSDRQRLYYVKWTGASYDLFVSYRTGPDWDDWTVGEALPQPINRGREFTGQISFDDSTLVFTSAGQPGHFEEAMFTSHLQLDSSWSETLPLAAHLNALNPSYHPCLTDFGNTLVFGMYGGEHFDIFYAVRNDTGFGPAIRCDSTINTPPWDNSPSSPAVGRYLIFDSNRNTQGLGAQKLFKANRRVLSPALERSLIPSLFSLSTYPNPFNATLSISLTVPPHQETTVTLYDLLGREVDEIYRGRLTNSTISYRAPAGLASGIYFVRATGEGTGAVMRKVVLLK